MTFNPITGENVGQWVGISVFMHCMNASSTTHGVAMGRAGLQPWGCKPAQPKASACIIQMHYYYYYYYYLLLSLALLFTITSKTPGPKYYGPN